jgi:homoserine kinase
VFAPATIANLGPGFDALGLALADFGDIVEARSLPDGAGRVIVAAMSGDAAGIPIESERNCAGRAATAVLERLTGDNRPAGGVELRVHKGLPQGSGLGSSACSAVGGAVATDLLCGGTLGQDDLLAAALEGEKVAAGEAHADNVAPSLLGGFTVVRSHAPPAVTRLPLPDDLRLVIVLPKMTIATREARALLPDRVALADATSNWAHAAAMVAAVARGDVREIGAAVVDRVIEPVRSRLIPGFDDVRRAALGAGAFGCSISGSGPALFAVALPATADAVGRAMREAFQRHGLEANCRTCTPDNRGAHRID